MIELLVYKYDDVNGEPIGQFPVRVEPQLLNEIKGNGGGSFRLPSSVVKSISNPDLLEYRNLIKFRVDGKITGGFVVGKQNDKSISPEERAGEYKTLAGEGPRIYLDDAAVQPMGGLQRASRTTRAFNFSSEQGAWYNPSDWVTPTNRAQVHSGSVWGRQFPEDFPENTAAQWIWFGPTPVGGQDPLGTCYFRYKFTTATEGQYAIYAACDNYLGVWLDGEHLATTDPDNWDSWHKATKITVTLPPGNHVLAFTGANAQHAGYNPAGLVMALMKVDGDQESLVGRSGTGDWKMLPYPTQAPAWTTGEVVLKLLQEAEDFGVLFPTWFTPTFTATTDSYGNPWDGALDWQFDVGESYMSVIQKLEELLCDVWIDLEAMTINMVNQRGVDRSVTKYDVDGVTILKAPVTFEQGKNLREAGSEGVGKIKNYLMIRSADGWILEDNEYDPSTLKYGKIMGKLDTDASEALSKQLAQVVFAQRGMAEEGANYDVIILPDGDIPGVDFFEGDWVLAPDKQGIPVKRRVMSISTQETETGQPIYTIEFDTIFKTNEQKLNQFMGKTGGGSLGSSFSNAGATPPTAGAPIEIPPASAIMTLPLAPDGLSATSVGRWTSDGMKTVSDVTLNWAPVTNNTDGSETVPAYYEVWGFPTSDPDALNLLFITATPPAVLPGLEPISWTFRVRAFNDSSRGSEFSDDLVYTAESPTTPMPAPTAPVATSEMGLMLLTWDGKLTGGVEPPPQFRYVYAQVKPSAGSVWQLVGATLPRGGGTISVPGLMVGDDYDARLFAVDGVDIQSAASPIDSTTITGIDLGSLDQDITDAIDAAQEAADAARESTNMLNDPSFELNTEQFWDWDATGVTNVTTLPRTGLRHLRITAKASPYLAFKYNDSMPCDAGETFQIRMYARVEESGVDDYIPEALKFEMVWSATEDMASPTTVEVGASLSLTTVGYTLVTADWLVPAGARFFYPQVRMNDVSSDNVYLVDDMRLLPKVGTLLIVEGSIIASHLGAESVTAAAIAAGSIAAEHIRAEAVTAEKLAADSVTANAIAAGAIQANHISAGAVQTNHLSPAVGNELDISANDTVTIIAGQIDQVQGDVNEAAASLELQQTYYSFGPTGAIISTPDSPFAVAIRNDRIEMLENGNPVSWWNSGQMVVPQLVGEKVILGNHQLEKYADGTVVRSLNA